MYFYYHVDIPPLTIESLAVKQTLLLAKGYAQFIDIGIPRRVERLAKCRVLYNEFQLVPFNRDEWLTGEDITLRIPLEIDLDEPPYNLLVLGINDDDTFPHEISFGVSIDTGVRVSNTQLDVFSQFVQVQEGGV